MLKIMNNIKQYLSTKELMFVNDGKRSVDRSAKRPEGKKEDDKASQIIDEAGMMKLAHEFKKMRNASTPKMSNGQVESRDQVASSHPKDHLPDPAKARGNEMSVSKENDDMILEEAVQEAIITLQSMGYTKNEPVVVTTPKGIDEHARAVCVDSTSTMPVPCTEQSDRRSSSNEKRTKKESGKRKKEPKDRRHSSRGRRPTKEKGKRKTSKKDKKKSETKVLRDELNSFIKVALDKEDKENSQHKPCISPSNAYVLSATNRVLSPTRVYSPSSVGSKQSSLPSKCKSPVALSPTHQAATESKSLLEKRLGKEMTIIVDEISN